MSKSLKKEMRREFAKIIPNVLPAVLSTPVNKETTVDEDMVFKKFNFRMAFATLAIIFAFALAGGGGVAYKNPNTYLTITFSPEKVKDMILNLSTNEEEVNFFNDSDVEYTLTLGVNPFDYVVEVDADNEALKNSIDNLNIKNTNLEYALMLIMNYAQNAGMIDLSRKEKSMQMNILTNYESRSEKIEAYLNNYLVDKRASRESVMVNPGMQVPFFKSPRDVMNGYSNSMGPLQAGFNQTSYGRVAVINEIIYMDNSYSEAQLSNASNRELAYILMKLKKKN